MTFFPPDDKVFWVNRRRGASVLVYPEGVYDEDSVMEVAFHGFRKKHAALVSIRAPSGYTVLKHELLITNPLYVEDKQEN